jgi:FkbM family methyltransferase
MTRPPDRVPPSIALGEQRWRIKPLYDVDRVTVFNKIKDRDRPFRFAELDLGGTPVRYCVSAPSTEWRVRTLFTKEPGTIDWLHSFAAGSVLVDVGANVGMYSIYAAAISGAKVYAFEPEAQNYAELCRSIYLNYGCRDNIHAFCAAIGDKPVEISRLLVRDLAIGYSGHDFTEPSRDYPAASRFAQGAVGFSLDYLVESGAIPPPDHVKIDVDGHEHKIIRGMQRLIERGNMRTLLLEADPALPHTREIVELILRSGWQVNPDQLRLSREGLRPAGAVMDELREGRYLGNIIFARRAEDLEFATHALERFSPDELKHMSLPK